MGIDRGCVRKIRHLEAGENRTDGRTRKEDHVYHWYIIYMTSPCNPVDHVYHWYIIYMTSPCNPVDLLPVPVQVVQERNATSYIVSHFYHLFYNIAVVPVSPTLLPVHLTTVVPQS